MRGTDDATSSFDLFLDTICNTFGGIVFLAILLAVMVQSRSVIKSIDQNDKHATPEQVQRANAKLEAASATWELLQMTLAGMPEPQSVFDDSQYIELTAIHDSLSQEMDELLKKESEAAKALAMIVEITAKQRQENETVPLALEDAKRANADAKADFKLLVDQKLETLRLPQVRLSSLATALVMVQGGAAYLAKEPSLFGQGFNHAQVTTTSQADSGIQIEPITGTGWDLSKSDGQAEFLATVRKAAGQSHAITLVIWADSYDRFSELRDTMVTEGVMYDLWPRSDGEVLKVFLGGGQSSVQ